MTRVFQRFSLDRVTVALKDTPVVLVDGPRQCGKTVLVRDLVAGPRRYVTLDDDTVLDGVRNDPAGFVRGSDRRTIDEIQRAPELLRAIKQVVDRRRRPGRFLLTGSANLMTLPIVSESLAGRMETITLLPLARAEIRGKKPTFLQKAFAGTIVPPPEVLTDDHLVQAVLTGGYPEMVRRRFAPRRRAWARNYVRTLVQRDVRDIAQIEHLERLPRLLQMLAHHAGQLTNFTQIGGQMGLDDKTTKRYVAIFEQLFLVRRLEPWYRNGLTRLVKTPKLHFLDSGLLGAMLNISAERVSRDRSLLGPLLETYVFAEVLKQAGWLDQTLTPSHYRDKDQDEVDIVLEDQRLAVVGIEIKAAATVKASDFKGLRKLAEAAGGRFRLGVVLYDGETIVPFGPRLFAAPVSCVWG